MNYVTSQRQNLIAARSSVLKIAALTPDAYSELLFDIGKRFAHQYCWQFPNHEAMYNVLTANKCYWDWFKLKYALEDQAFVQIASRLGHTEGWPLFVTGTGNIVEPSYEDLKAAMIGDNLLETELSHYLKSVL